MKNINYKKKLAQLKYKDLILDLHKNQKSIRDITYDVNYRLARSNLKTSLSIFTIHSIIKKAKNDLQGR
jgi:hypothetical protein